LAPTAACDSAACLLLALGAADLAAHAWTDWALLALTSVCIYLFGMGLNDWADRERDRMLAPDRALPSGALDPRAALAVVLALGAAALALGGGPLGARGVVAGALAAAALYDLSPKRPVVLGAAAMGWVRAMNAGLAVLPLVAAGAAPAWVLGAPLAVGLYAAGITVLSTTEEEPSPARVWTARLLAAAALAGACALAMLAAGRFTFAPVLAVGSVVSLCVGRLPRPGPVKRQVLEMLLGLYLLAAVIAGGSGSGYVELVALVLAFFWIWLSQVAIRALRPR
jgi:heme O synthase-like polyprenyltransferase